MASLSVVFSRNDNSPDTLFNISLECIVNRLGYVSRLDPSGWRKLKDHISFPAEICERIFERYQKNYCVNDNIAKLFQVRHKSNVDIVKLKNSRISDEGFRYFMEHKPLEVQLDRCQYLTQKSLEHLNNNSQNLISLTLGHLTYVISQDQNAYYPRGCVLYAPKLKKLVIHHHGNALFPLLVVKPHRNLVYLDLSECPSIGSTMRTLETLNNLQYLILYDVHWIQDVIEWLCTLRSLKHLDLSVSNERFGTYEEPDRVLTNLIANLPNLKSLDISGTNLAGIGASVVNEKQNANGIIQHIRCDIPGLLNRVENPLEFLGLYETKHRACKRHDIPAIKITGDANPEQLLLAAQTYMQKPALLTHVLNDIYYLFRYENDASVSEALGLILKAMDEHLSEKHVQISGSATLFYIVKGEVKQNMGIKLKRRIIKALVDAMESHLGDETMMRNGCLCLCQFQIPGDVLFEYERIVTILLTGLSDLSQEGFVLRIAIYLLNSLACQVDNKQKRYLGVSGAIEKMLNLIADRLEKRLCDDVLEVAWSTMWNVTDETPENCSSFIEHNGIDFFLACLERFPDKEELLRNMMGLLGNVAEVPDLRPSLMSPFLLSVFYDLLNSSCDGIEVSYNAAGVIAHIASDGPQAWLVNVPNRAAVLQRVSEAVSRWDLHSERNINYRSFEPILCLLQTEHTPECQLWAVWALANLTTVYPQKYCPLLIEEGGINMVNMILIDENQQESIQVLAYLVIRNCTQYANQVNSPRPQTPHSPDN